jgi:hypothetical protein
MAFNEKTPAATVNRSEPRVTLLARYFVRLHVRLLR